jgi:hypothetical protein
MHLKVFVKLKETLKTLSSGQKTPKKKKKKKTKKNHWAGFFYKKPGFFPTLFVTRVLNQVRQKGELFRQSNI